MEKNDFKGIEIILKYSPLVIALLISMGFLNLYLYYNSFGVEILDFLEISEILISFFDDIFLSIIIFISTIILFLTLIFLKWSISKKPFRISTSNLIFIGSLILISFQLKFLLTKLSLPINIISPFLGFSYALIGLLTLRKQASNLFTNLAKRIDTISHKNLNIVFISH